MTHRTQTRLSIEGTVATLTLARGEIRNAITGPLMLEELIGAITESESAGALVLVITGEGPAFSAGGNVLEMAEKTGLFSGTPDEMAEAYRRTIQRLTSTLLRTDLVTVAAVNGAAVGAGFDLVLGCDLRIGSSSARFAHTFIDLGIVPGDGGAWLLPRVVGWQRASELAFTARMIDAAEAREIGVLLEVVEPDDLIPRALELASLIGSKPAHSVRLTKRLLRHARTMGLDEFLDLSASYQAISHHTEAHDRAVLDFMERWKR